VLVPVTFVSTLTLGKVTLSSVKLVQLGYKCTYTVHPLTLLSSRTIQKLKGITANTSASLLHYAEISFLCPPNQSPPPNSSFPQDTYEFLEHKANALHSFTTKHTLNIINKCFQHYIHLTHQYSTLPYTRYVHYNSLLPNKPSRALVYRTAC
jgi:hypothetical protein